MGWNRFSSGRLVQRCRCPGISYHRRHRTHRKDDDEGQDSILTTILLFVNTVVAKIPWLNDESSGEDSSSNHAPSALLILLLLASPLPVIFSAFISLLTPAAFIFGMTSVAILGFITHTLTPFMLKHHYDYQQQHLNRYRPSSHTTFDKLYRVFLFGVSSSLCPPPSDAFNIIDWIADNVIFTPIACTVTAFGEELHKQWLSTENPSAHKKTNFVTPVQAISYLASICLSGIKPKFVVTHPSSSNQASVSNHDSVSNQASNHANHAATQASASANTEEVTTPAKVVQRDMKEKHRAVFNRRAFGVDNDGNPLPDDDSSESKNKNKKHLTQNKWAEIIHVRSNWHTPAESANLSESEQSQAKQFRTANKQGYDFHKKYVVEEEEEPGLAPTKKLRRVETKREPSTYRLVIPQLKLFDAIYEAHQAACHSGQERTYTAASAKYYSVTQDLVKIFCETCPECAAKQPVIAPERGAKKPILSHEFVPCRRSNVLIVA